METLLVTGGCGFIGSHFVDLVLKSNQYHVVNIDKMTYASMFYRLRDFKKFNYQFVKADICDEERIRAVFDTFKPNLIVNFAAESHVQRSIDGPAEFIRSNVEGVRVLLDCARSHSVRRFLQVSTDEVYGDRRGLPAATETDPLNPSSPYSASKASADLLCFAYRRTYGIPVLITRSTNNYGPFQYPEKLVPILILNGIKGKPLEYHGDGTHVRNWIYVEDNCRAILEVLEKGNVGEIYNVSGDVSVSTVDLGRDITGWLDVEELSGFQKRQLRTKFIKDRPGNDHTYAVSSRKIRWELGWCPDVSYVEGLKRTIRWYNEHINPASLVSLRS